MLPLSDFHTCFYAKFIDLHRDIFLHRMLQQTLDGLEELSAKQHIIEDQQKELLADRSTPLRKYNIYVAIQTPAYERGDDYHDCESIQPFKHRVSDRMSI